jgi:spore maturation protein CgeB
MKLVVFGLTVSSSWGNGHATLWRALIKALSRRGHEVVFFERDVDYYAWHRDLWELPQGRLLLYPDWESVLPLARRELAGSDVAMVTSYCPDALAAADLILDSPVPLRTFYDLDTPVTLSRLESGEPVAYIGPRGLKDFDLVLSYTGGKALSLLAERLGARRVAPIYGSVDPDVHYPIPPVEVFRSDFSYLGTYAEDRQVALETLFIEPARRLPGKRFLIGGTNYPEDFPWTDNLYFVRHIPPPDHPAFYSSSPLTLNVTRRAMAEMGYCPQGRLFEAAACGAAILSDVWEGLDAFYTPGSEILVAGDTDGAIEAIGRNRGELAALALAARERTLEEHTSDRRARDLEEALSGLGTPAESLSPSGAGGAASSPKGKGNG